MMIGPPGWCCNGGLGQEESLLEDTGERDLATSCHCQGNRALLAFWLPFNPFWYLFVEMTLIGRRMSQQGPMLDKRQTRPCMITLELMGGKDFETRNKFSNVIALVDALRIFAFLMPSHKPRQSMQMLVLHTRSDITDSTCWDPHFHFLTLTLDLFFPLCGSLRNIKNSNVSRASPFNPWLCNFEQHRTALAAYVSESTLQDCIPHWAIMGYY